MTGTDEHGQKVERSAQTNGLSPQSFSDQVSARFRSLADKMGCSHNDFIRTTEARHKEGVQSLWRRLEDKGFIYKGSYDGWYSIRDEAFYQESELIDGKAPTGAEVRYMQKHTPTDCNFKLFT